MAATILNSAKAESPANVHSSNSSIQTTEPGSSDGASSSSQSSPVLSSSTTSQPQPPTTEKPKHDLNLPPGVNTREAPLPILNGRMIKMSPRPLAEGGCSNVWQGTRYLSYELVSDNDEDYPKPTTETDIYALACIGMQVGTLPFQSLPP